MSGENSSAISRISAIVPRDIKGKMVDATANKIYSYTAYDSAEQTKQMASTLTEKFPSLKCSSAS